MNVALILAGGSGKRTEQDVPKQFINVFDKPIIIYTLEAFQKHPDIDGMMEALKKQDLKGLAGLMEAGNVLETVTVPAYPVIQRIKDAMLRAGALGALMSGSGPTVFGIFDSRQAAKRAYGVLKRGHLAKQIFLTTPYNNRSFGG